MAGQPDDVSRETALPANSSLTPDSDSGEVTAARPHGGAPGDLASSPSAPTPPPVATGVFGPRMPMAEVLAALLADTGVSHGLIGPREVPRLWDRHILNCAVLESRLPQGSRLIDVGSGAGLPGLVLAVVRPDLEIALVEPMQRRTEWLQAAVESLGVTNVSVHRGRAEEFVGELEAPFTTARAVARLDKLARWCLPLTERGGTLLAMKGRSAADEVDATRPGVRRAGGGDTAVIALGEGVLEEPTMVVEVVRR